MFERGLNVIEVSSISGHKELRMLKRIRISPLTISLLVLGRLSYRSWRACCARPLASWAGALHASAVKLSPRKPRVTEGDVSGLHRHSGVVTTAPYLSLCNMPT